MQFSYSTELRDDLFDQQNEIRSKEKNSEKNAYAGFCSGQMFDLFL